MENDSESRIDSSSTTDRTSKSSNIESLGLSHSKLAYDGNFIRSASGVFMAGEIVNICLTGYGVLCRKYNCVFQNLEIKM
ncbi:hypothetical protein cypCar_00036684 [Cyprinus carpio]|nr:hypothetical protein cypCar_00036684 [Cyprinus carpio]